MKSNVRRITGSGSGGGSGGGGGGGSCGRSGFAAASGRIMYGGYASQGEFPWLAYTTAANSACGSTLISDRWMLTAAHCLPPPGAGASIKFCFGSNNVRSCKQEVTSTAIFPHPSKEKKNP